MRKTMTRLGAGLVGVTAAMALAAPAFAHVTVNPDEATQGGYTKLTFRVPNEKDTASTTALEVNFPVATPIASISVKPTPGWTAEVTKTRLDQPIKSDDGEITDAVTKIVWKASGADTAVKPGQFQEFDVSAGPLPEVDKIVFKVLQTYSDGDVVRWIEEPGADGKEPEHPAPTLKLTKAAATEGGTGVTATAEDESDDSGRANAALVLAVVALIVAVGGTVLALRRRGATPAPGA